MRVLISAGGTGGGIYPALSVAKELQISDFGFRIEENQSAIRNPQFEILWVGGAGGMEGEIVARAGLAFRAVRGGGLHGVGWRLPANMLNLAWGLLEAARLVRAYRPDVLFVTGGFVAAPVALAAWLNRVPILLYVPDIEPALAAQFIGRLARRIAVTVEQSRKYYAGRDVVVTGYPTRPELARAARAEGVAHFKLDPRRRTLLVTGGSRGARSLNRAVFAALPGLLRDYQVIHLTGQLDWVEAEQTQAALPSELRAYYRAYPFLHEMGLALSAADLVASRAGASALGEYPLFGLPAILAPYPYAWRYQKVNAEYLVQRGAAIRVDDNDLPVRLALEVRRLLDDPARLDQMRRAARATATPEAARRIAQELVALAAGPRRGVQGTARGGGALPR